MKRAKLNKISREALKNFAWEFTRDKIKEAQLVRDFCLFLEEAQVMTFLGFPEEHRSILALYNKASYAKSLLISFNEQSIMVCVDGRFSFERDHAHTWKLGNRVKTELFCFDDLLSEHKDNGLLLPRMQINPLNGDEWQYELDHQMGLMSAIKTLEENIEKYRLLLDKKRKKYVKLLHQATYCDEVLKYWPKASHVLERFINPGRLMVVTPLEPDEIKAMEEENAS